MTRFVLPPAPVPSISTTDGESRFALRRVFCVGRNYAEHAREMGHDPNREPPFFFTKPADAVIAAGQPVPYPPQTTDLHHEAELVVAIGTGGHDIPASSALDHVWGYGIGNDLTRRDLQAQAKKLGRPWDMAKGFNGSFVCGPLHPAASIGHPAQGAVRLWVNGTLRQDGDLSEMIWPVADIIAHLSASVALAPGDVIMTGTPAGVGALMRGDTCEIEIAGLGRITSTIAG